MNSGYEQLVGPTVFVISGPNLSSNIIKIYILMYSRLKYISIELKNIQIGVRTKKL